MNTKIIIGLIIIIVIGAGALFFNYSSSPLDTYTNNTNTTTTTNVVVPPTPTSTHTGTEDQSKNYTLAMVATHKNATSCWSTINGKVYDLTSWINKHPGGPQRILSICGKDGSSAFNGQHGGQSRPADELAGFYIGELDK